MAIALRAGLVLFSLVAFALALYGKGEGHRGGEAMSRYAATVDQAEALSKSGQTARALLVLNPFVDNFRLSPGKASHADTLLLARALMLNARLCSDLGNQPQALTLLRRALPLVKASGDNVRLAALYNNIFAIYYASHEYEQAEDLLSASLQLSMQARDSASIRNNYNNFGLMYLERRQYAQALGYMDKALLYAPRADRNGRSLILTNRAEALFRQGRTREAELTLRAALDLQQGQPFDARTLQTSLNMAFLQARKGNRHEALQLQRRLYALIPRAPLPMQANSYEQMADINFHLGDSLAALRDIMRYLPLRDSLQRADNSSQLQQLLVAYDADRLKQHNTNLRQTVDIYRLKAKARFRLLVATLAFLVALAVLIVMLARRMRADRAKSALISRQQQQLLAYEQQERQREQEEMRHKQDVLRHRQEQMALEIDHKNRQLTTYTIDLAAVNEFHQRIINALTALREKKQAPAEADRQMKDLVLSLQHFNDKPLGDDFRVYFDEVHPGFLMRLSQKHGLSKADLRLCAYLHLGMTTKEIAALTFKEVRSIESARNRLRKKLDLPPETNLQQYLAQFAVQP